MKRFENLAMRSLLADAMRLCREKKNVQSVAYPLVEFIQAEAAHLFGKDPLDETGFYELLRDSGSLINAARNSRIVVGTTDTLRFHYDALSIVRAYHRSTLNEVSARVVCFIRESAENYFNQFYGKSQAPEENQTLRELILQRADNILAQLDGSTCSNNSYITFLMSREELLEKFLIRGLVGRIARSYWDYLLHPAFESRKYVTKIYDELKVRVYTCASAAWLPEISSRSPHDRRLSSSAYYDAVLNSLAFIDELSLQIACTRGPEAVFSETEIGFCERFASELESAIGNITDIDCSPLYDRCALIRARTSSIT